MIFRVIWRLALLDQLAAFYLAALEQGQDAEAITAAVAEIDRLLQSAPQTRGESRSPHERILIELPLAVEFEVHEEDRIVYVLSLRYAPRHGQEN